MVVKIFCVLAILGGGGFIATFSMYIILAARNDPDDMPVLDRIQNCMMIAMFMSLVCLLFAGAIAAASIPF